MDNKNHRNHKPYKNNKNTKGKWDNRDRKPQSDASYRFRRVLGEILKFLKSLPHESDFNNCQKEYGEQLTELIQKGYTWGFAYPIPVHDSDFSALQKKEWAAIRAIVRKQEYGVSNSRR